MKLTLISLFSLTLLISGCNGSSSDDPSNMEGVWRGAATRSVDECRGSNAPQTINFQHNVDQVDEAITLTAEDGRSYLGNTLSDTGFSVDAPAESENVGGVECLSIRRIAYHDIVDDDDENSGIEITVLRECGGEDCRLQYSGTAIREIAGVSPTPAPGTTPAAGGCPAINPNPERGTYLGDGGCGISEVTYSVRNDGAGNTFVVLEPFGSNSATSFTVNSLNISEANSTNADLEINGQTGYSCQLACTAPSTFSISCFREGAVSCTEKF